MAYKTYDYKSFDFVKPDGSILKVRCYSQGTSYGFRHVAEADSGTARACYYNRTWECFQYESVLRALFKKRPFYLAQIKKIEKETQEEAEKWADDFKERYKKLSPEVKEALKKSDVIVNTQEEADSLMRISELFSEVI